MKRSNRALLQDILQSIDFIKTDTYGFDLEMFRNERTIRDAVYRNFEIIGEAIKRLDPHVKGLSPDTPWQKIAGFRDILIHHYFGVDIEFVWSVIEQNLDDLEETVQTLLNQILQNDL